MVTARVVMAACTIELIGERGLQPRGRKARVPNEPPPTTHQNAVSVQPRLH